jgi:mannose-1-phosphate guanylyltransferase
VLSFRGDLGAEGAAGRGVFAGLHLISRRLLEGVEPRPADIVRQLYEPLLEAGGAIRAVYTDLRWHDLGLPSRYLAAVLDELRAATADEAGSWIAAAAGVDASSSVERSVVEGDAEVGPGATVRGSLLLSGARLARGASVVDSVLGPGVEIGRDARVASQLVTRGEGLVFTPMEGVGTA